MRSSRRLSVRAPASCIASLLAVVYGCDGPPDQSGGWALRFGGVGSDGGQQLRVAPNGDIVVTGSFQRTADFEDTMISSIGEFDAFLAILSSEGEISWVRSWGGEASTVWGVDVAAGEDGLALVGNFRGELRVGEIIFRSGSPFVTNAFVLYFDRAGELHWAHHLRGDSNVAGSSVTIDDDGAIVVAGDFTDSMMVTEQMALASAGGTDVFLASFDRGDGSLLWARSAGGEEDDYPWSVVASRDKEILVAGSVSGVVELGCGVRANAAQESPFVAAYDRGDGDCLWDAVAEGTGRATATALAVASDGAFLAGWFDTSLDFGTGLHESGGERSAFLVAVNPASGQPLWTRSIAASSGFVVPTSLSAIEGGVVLAGRFEGSIDAGPDALVADVGGDVLVARYSSSGMTDWVTSAGGQGVDFATGVDSDGDQIVVTGVFERSAQFGPHRLDSRGMFDVFVTRLPPQ